MQTNSVLIKNRKSQTDYWLILTTIFLVFVGLLAIYDSSVVTAFRDFHDRFYFLKNQLVWVSLGFISLVFFSYFNYQNLIKLAPIIIAFSTLLLVLVMIPFIGTEALGARRWITIGSFTFQPSEFAKLAIIIYAASMMAKFNNFKIRLLDAAIVYFLPVLLLTFLVTIQPDLGTALIFLAIASIIYFIGNGPIWHFMVVLPIAAGGALLAITTAPYRLERLRAFINPNYDPSGASYQINQIILALSNGGLFGVGIGASRSKFEFIPEVHNDAIFAVIVEEIGFIGATILISIFLFLFFRAIKIAREATDFSARVLAGGLACLLAIQSLFNFASVVALVPLTGVPLPFISYGGSSLFITLTAIGILINIGRKS